MTSPGSPNILLGLADEYPEELIGAPFIGAFVSLGSLLRTYSVGLIGRQLVVAISAPRRDYVAALIASGWVLKSPAPNLGEPVDTFRHADGDTYLRAVTENKIIVGRFTRLDEARTPPRVLTGGINRIVDRYRAVSRLNEPHGNIEGDVPEKGYLATLTGTADSWLDRIADPPQDLALVGTIKWIQEDLAAVIGKANSTNETAVPLGNYVLPFSVGAATWATVLIPSARLGDGGEIPKNCGAALLDQYGAIKYLNDIETPVVVCLIDRSVPDESAAEHVIQSRASGSRPISVASDIKWQPPFGVEALAFTVAL